MESEVRNLASEEEVFKIKDTTLDRKGAYYERPQAYVKYPLLSIGIPYRTHHYSTLRRHFSGYRSRFTECTLSTQNCVINFKRDRIEVFLFRRTGCGDRGSEPTHWLLVSVINPSLPNPLIREYKKSGSVDRSMEGKKISSQFTKKGVNNDCQFAGESGRKSQQPDSG